MVAIPHKLRRHWSLYLVIILLPISAVSCGKPSPRMVVQRYLEAISSKEVDEEKVSRYITERYRDDLLQNALLAEIKAAKGNYYDLLTPLMSSEDTRLIEQSYDFKVTYREFIEEGIALVKVYMRPIPKVDDEDNKALQSETLHPLLKRVLREQINSEFLVKLKPRDGLWKIDDVIYPGDLEKVVRDRSSATVTIPPLSEGTDDAAGAEEGDDA